MEFFYRNFYSLLLIKGGIKIPKPGKNRSRKKTPYIYMEFFSSTTKTYGFCPCFFPKRLFVIDEKAANFLRLVSNIIEILFSSYAFFVLFPFGVFVWLPWVWFGFNLFFLFHLLPLVVVYKTPAYAILCGVRANSINH